MVIEAARANGWTAEAEVSERTPSGELWRADVLATLGRYRVAVEIQWSSQTLEEAEFRQKRYKESGVRGLWIMRRAECPPREDLPAVAIRGSLDKGLHSAILNMLGRMHSVSERNTITMAGAAANLERAFQSGLETYYRLKRGVQQVVRIERVEVKEGGQAVIGVVRT